MKYDCTKATLICIWYIKNYHDENKIWRLTSMAPKEMEHMPIDRELKDGDEIDISNNCKIDINRRVMIDGNKFTLVVYGGNNVIVKVNRL